MRRIVKGKRQKEITKCIYAEEAGKTAVQMWAIQKDFYEVDSGKMQQLVDERVSEIQQAIDYKNAQLSELKSLEKTVVQEKLLKENAEK